ncbi:MAG: glycosyltransferase [Lachnospiraceae bacterium]|nr:glycosyltransferase [Lachnospiraceae bacterium]
MKSLGIELLKAGSFIKRNGLRRAACRSVEYVKDRKRDDKYNALMHRERAKRDRTRFEEAVLSGAGIKFSVIVPTYESNAIYLKRLIDSVLGQSYGEFELLIVDGSKSRTVFDTLSVYNDGRIRYLKLEENKGISENTNAGIKAARGNYLTFVDHDDFLESDALLESARAISKGARLVYTDEDKYDGSSDRYFAPNFKPDYNKDLFLSNNYICHLFTVEKAVALKAGLFRKEFDGAQDYDFILRCIEAVKGKNIGHVKKVLYHWRVHPDSTAGNPAAKLYAYESGKRALEDYLKRNSLKGTVKDSAHLGFYRIEYSTDLSDKEYTVFISEDLKPLQAEYESLMASYLEREDIGAVGARIVDGWDKILYSGTRVLPDGRMKQLYTGMNRYYSGYMHRASMQQDVDALSMDICLIRSSLLTDDDMSPGELFKNIREMGYRIIMDPEIVFRR